MVSKKKGTQEKSRSDRKHSDVYLVFICFDYMNTRYQQPVPKNLVAFDKYTNFE